METLPTDRYLVVVDNWCSNDADDDPTTPDPDEANCPIGDDPPANEDDFFGYVTLNPIEEVNTLPSVTLTGPDSRDDGPEAATTPRPAPTPAARSPTTASTSTATGSSRPTP